MTSHTSMDAGFPFADFIENEAAYDNSRRFWSEAFAEVVQESGWHDWMRDPLRDGNPIFSKFATGPGRGILVQQTAQSDDPAWFKCWMSCFQAADRSVPYLFIETFVSDPSRVRFQRLVKAWCSDGLDEAALQTLTGEVRLEALSEFHGLEATSFGLR